MIEVINGYELLDAKKERRRPVPEAVVDEWPKRSVVRILDKPASEEAYDGTEG